MIEPRRSAVIVPVELPPSLERARLASDPMAALGVPAHITLLFPFLEPSTVGGAVLSRLRGVVRSQPRFGFALAEVRTFPTADGSPGVVYLASEPAAPFSRLTRAIWAAWPDHPPYEGAHEEVIPHLTIADHTTGAAEIEALAAAELPIPRRAEEAWLLVEGEDDRWRPGARLPLGGPERAGDEPAGEEGQAE
jgi:2'-5' RNA ligase